MDKKLQFNSVALTIIIMAVLVSCSHASQPGEYQSDHNEYELPAYLPFVNSITALQPLHEGINDPAVFRLDLSCDGNPAVLKGYEWLDQFDPVTGDPGADPHSLNVVKDFYSSDGHYEIPTRVITLRPWIVNPPIDGAASSTKLFHLNRIRLASGTLTIRIESAPDAASAGASALTYHFNDNASNFSDDYFIGSIPTVYKEFTLEVLPAEAAP